MEQIKFTQEEVEQINQLRDDVSLVFVQMGQVALERKKRLEELEEILTVLSTEEWSRPINSGSFGE